MHFVFVYFRYLSNVKMFEKQQRLRSYRELGHEMEEIVLEMNTIKKEMENKKWGMERLAKQRRGEGDGEEEEGERGY